MPARASASASASSFSSLPIYSLIFSPIVIIFISVILAMMGVLLYLVFSMRHQLEEIKGSEKNNRNEKKDSFKPYPIKNNPNITMKEEDDEDDNDESDDEYENEQQNNKNNEDEPKNEIKESAIYSLSHGTPMENRLPIPLNMIPISARGMYLRDRAVVEDPLYPPLNRNSLEPHDNYRMVGYLVSEESQEDSWQLFGRKTNSNRAEFYVRPTNKNLEMKIPIQESDFRRPEHRLRDIDNLPETTSINNPLFNSDTYKVVVNPNTNYESLYF